MKLTRAELDRYHAELRRLPAPRTEARVLRAVLTEPEKLARAVDTEVDDFAHPGNRWAFTHVRNLEATGAEVDAIAVCQADEMRREAFGAADHECAMAVHLRDHVFTLARPYELDFGFDGDLALFVFDGDRHQLRLIADARRAA